jgi:ribosomal subunit interface protein
VDIVITGRHTEASDRFRRLAEDKLAKVAQLAPKAYRVDVELSHEPNPRQSQTCKKVEITVRVKGPVIRAEACADEPYAALDLAVGKLLERLRRMRDRRKVHHGRQTPASLRQSVPADLGVPPPTVPMGDYDDAGDDAAGGEGPDTAEFSPIVIRTKDHQATPMTLDQALYEMELIGHDFFLFVDAASHRPCVVYRRHGWSYGVIRLQVEEDDELATPIPHAHDANGHVNGFEPVPEAQGMSAVGTAVG